MRPVSYTHLDVYKRQAVHLAPVPQAFDPQHAEPAHQHRIQIGGAVHAGDRHRRHDLVFVQGGIPAQLADHRLGALVLVVRQIAGLFFFLRRRAAPAPVSYTHLHCNVVLKAAPGGLILALREMIPDYFCEGRLWEKLAAFVRREGAEPLPGASSLAIFYGGGGQEAVSYTHLDVYKRQTVGGATVVVTNVERFEKL